MAIGDKNYDIATKSNQTKILEKIGNPSQESTTQQILDNLGDFSSTDTLKQAIVSLATEIDNIKSSLSEGGIDEKLDNIIDLSQDNPVTTFISTGDTIFKTINKTISSPSSSSTSKDIGSFTPAYSGTLTLNITGSYSTSYTGDKKVTVSINGGNDGSCTVVNNQTGNTGTFTMSANATIEVTAGKLYALTFYASNVSDSISFVINIKGSKVINNGII